MKTPIRITKIGAYVPSKKVNSLERAQSFEYGQDFLENKLGTTSLAVKEPDENASDLCVKAARHLQEQGEDFLGVGLVVVCTQTPDGHGIPHTSAVVHKKLDLADECACFDISLGCSGYVYGLSVVTAFMEANGICRGLFFTSDPYSTIVDPSDQATCLLFGDAATATLLTNEGSGWRLADVLFGTQGKGGDAINNQSGKLQMDGRAVFNFAMTVVPRQVHVLLERKQLTVDDLDLVILHQGSRYIVEKLRERLKLPQEKVPVHLDGIGNSVSSAIPLALLSAWDRVPEGGRILLSGFGVGLSFATGLLEHQS